jgi:hypothetical protein
MGTRMTFEQWKQRVDVELDKLGYMPQIFLPDWLARDAFDDNLTPREGAIECLESAGIDYERVLDEV